LEVALGLAAALVGASGALVGTWLSGRHAGRLEHEKWLRSRMDAAANARAEAIQGLTQHLADAAQTITWFTYAATNRPFTEQTISDYDVEMRGHLGAVMQGLVAVAHHDVTAFRVLDQLASEVWALDGRVAGLSARFWTDPKRAREAIGAELKHAYALRRYAVSRRDRPPGGQRRESSKRLSGGRLARARSRRESL
jgi:hypothetical protein